VLMAMNPEARRGQSAYNSMAPGEIKEQVLTF